MSGTSLILNNQGYPHVSYQADPSYGDYQSQLKYAYRTATGWHVQILDSDGAVGAWSLLALDSYGYPHISYSDRHPNYDLKYARFISGFSESPAVMPEAIHLVSVAPNPFSSFTELCWELELPALVEALVFDLLGREVALVARRQADTGVQRLLWRPANLRSGAYILRVYVDGETAAVRRLIYRK